jgi:hypothetical protein
VKLSCETAKRAARAAGLLLGFGLSGTAHAEVRAVPESPRSRVQLGGLFGHTADLSVTIDGVPGREPNRRQANGGVALGYDRLLVWWFSAGVIGRFETWQSTWSSNAGYERTRFDLAIVPKLRPRLLTSSAPIFTYFSLPIGLARSSMGGRTARLVGERWTFDTGYTVGVNAGLEFWVDRWAGFLDLGYYVHKAAGVGAFTPPSGPTVMQRFGYTTDTIMATLGVEFGF